jgi:hypothetical protein
LIPSWTWWISHESHHSWVRTFSKSSDPLIWQWIVRLFRLMRKRKGKSQSSWIGGCIWFSFHTDQSLWDDWRAEICISIRFRFISSWNRYWLFKRFSTHLTKKEAVRQDIQ